MTAKGAPIECADVRSTRRSWLIFSGCIICQVCAGHAYWFPSVGQGLRTSLSLTDSELTTVLAVINSGSLLGFAGGILYDRKGARVTTCVGASISAVCYALLALLVRMRAYAAFPLVVLLAAALVASSFFVYAASMATVVAHFPGKTRGRVVAFHSAMYGMSSGVIATLQAAFFPSTDSTDLLLAFVAAFVALPAAIAFFLFPDKPPAVHRAMPDAVDMEQTVNGNATELMPLLPRDAQGDDDAGPWYRRGDTSLMAFAYTIALIIFLVLQVGAFASWTSAPRVHLPDILAHLIPWLPRSMRAETLCAIILLFLVSLLMLLPLGAPPTARVSPAAHTTTPSHAPTSPRVSFITIAHDFRYQILVLSFFVIPGSGTIAVLVHIGGVAASRQFESLHNALAPASLGTGESVAAAVRALVSAFSACNLLSRLIAGGAADVGGTSRGRESMRLRLLQADALAMAVAVLGVAFAPHQALILAVALVGFAHGTFFAVTPALCAGWFGVDAFPLAFAVAGGGITVAVLSTASWIPTLVADVVMKNSWVDALTSAGATSMQRFCVGVLCFAPAFSIIAAMCVFLFVALLKLHSRFLALV